MHAESLHSLTEISSSFQRPLVGALIYASQTKLLLLRAQRGTTGQKRRCFNRLVSAMELVGMSLENLRHADSQTPQTFQIAEGAMRETGRHDLLAVVFPERYPDGPPKIIPPLAPLGSDTIPMFGDLTPESYGVD